MLVYFVSLVFSISSSSVFSPRCRVYSCSCFTLLAFVVIFCVLCVIFAVSLSLILIICVLLPCCSLITLSYINSGIFPSVFLSGSVQPPSVFPPCFGFSLPFACGFLCSDFESAKIKPCFFYFSFCLWVCILVLVLQFLWHLSYSVFAWLHMAEFV